ncbi:uncharacterized protein UV8b_06318 [Ustilaginoidea virens]|uniref:Enolase-phosphatase E1 n=1 Tax=Ustilaginoidea virens TaxID=1159556 RepID=A0A8E5HV68_USTVR|nr:uncharacterized protein UV8b_06318 [Ustilaginoidea virens]QUC22077.1 hypothetical protein UV8b_06318 [Ustilaginoidea virens]
MLATAFADFDVVILDIEGTICPITFVHDVLFPYALKALPKYLDDHWNTIGFAPYQKSFPEDCRADRLAFESHVHDLVARDVKAPYLKALQGLLWESGYHSGEIKAPVYCDVAPFISAAYSARKILIIYSSGSVRAQKLFFAHTTAEPSNLTQFISGWFDTVNAGPKTEPSSYATILASYKEIKPSRWLFLSDNPLEVRAALLAGLRSLVVARPGNAPLPPDSYFSSIAIPDFSHQSETKIKQSLEALEQVTEY